MQRAGRGGEEVLHPQGVKKTSSPPRRALQRSSTRGSPFAKPGTHGRLFFHLNVMPYRRTSGRSFRRRRRVLTTARRRSSRRAGPRFRRAARYNRRAAGPLRSIGPLWANSVPQTQRLRFRYADNAFAEFVTGPSYQSLHVFRGNSLQDPDYTGFGVQPYGFDQWTAVLGGDPSYKVWGSSIAVNYTIVSSTIRDLKVFVIPSRLTVLTNHDISDLRQMPRARWKASDGVVGHTGRSWVTNYCSTSFLFRLATVRDWGFGATGASNPEIPWYWHVYFDAGDTAEEPEVLFDVRITYYATMTRIASQDES